MTKSSEENPLQKLIQGFCSPQKMKTAPVHDDDDDANKKYVPDLSPQKQVANGNVDATPEKETINETIIVDPPDSDPAAADQSDPIATEDATGESVPGDDVSKKTIANRKKYGLENFVVACIFVLVTLLALKKLGLTSSSIDLSSGSGGDESASWINVVDKSSMKDEVDEEPPIAIDETPSDEIGEESPVKTDETPSEDTGGDEIDETSLEGTGGDDITEVATDSDEL